MMDSFRLKDYSPLIVELSYEKSLPLTDLVGLYGSVGWTAYTAEPSRLGEAVANSTFVVSAWEAGALIGLARSLSDDVAIFYLQDILVRPDFQRRGIGKILLETCLERFAHVRTKVLLTDDSPAQLAFYASAGFENLKQYRDGRLNAFIRMKER